MKIVIFDMDGTLIDSKKDITLSINHIRNLHYNLPPLEESFVVDAINQQVRNLPKLFYETEVYEESDRAVFEVHYKEQCTKNPYLYEGVHETLHKLKEADVKLSVATNAPTVFAQTMLAHLEVDHLFDVIIGADRVSASKPSPEMIHEILNHYSYDGARDLAWMVGDNSKDIQSAKNANIDALFATWGFSPQTDHEKIVQTPKEILSIVL